MIPAFVGRGRHKESIFAEETPTFQRLPLATVFKAVILPWELCRDVHTPHSLGVVRAGSINSSGVILPLSLNAGSRKKMFWRVKSLQRQTGTQTNKEPGT